MLFNAYSSKYVFPLLLALSLEASGSQTLYYSWGLYHLPVVYLGYLVVSLALLTVFGRTVCFFLAMNDDVLGKHGVLFQQKRSIFPP